MDHFRNPRNAGTIEQPDAVGEIGNPADGDLVKIYLKIDSNHLISDIKFQTFGCAAAIACSSITTELVKGKHINEAENLSKQDVADALDGLPPMKMHCSNLGADALRLAIRSYKKAHNLPVNEDLLDNLKPDSDLIDRNPKDGEPNLTLDLRGKQCPMTFVYTKVGLESLQHGQIAKVILDFPPAFRNVPDSVKAQKLGEIVHEVQEGELKTYWIKKT